MSLPLAVVASGLPRGDGHAECLSRYSQQMTPDAENELAERILGPGTSALVVPDGELGRHWIPGRLTAAELVCGVRLPPVTRTEARIAASMAAVLGGYRGRRAPQPGSWR
jgi:hypothetical protein